LSFASDLDLDFVQEESVDCDDFVADLFGLTEVPIVKYLEKNYGEMVIKHFCESQPSIVREDRRELEKIGGTISSAEGIS